jgi:hypothetical protein
MKKILITGIFIMLVNIVWAQESKTIQIYNNNITHTNIKAILTYLDSTIIKDDVYYTVTYATAWTGRLNTVVVYNGDLEQMAKFLKLVLQFGEENKDNIGASIKIEGRIISMTKQFGIKCIAIKIGSESINTNFKSISQAAEELDNWIKENKK